MTSQEEDINLDSSPEPSANSKDNALFKPKPKPKLIRVLTVLAYILSVSMAAILLSIYYIFMWDGQPHLGARRDYAIFNHSVASIIVESANYKSRIQNKTVPLDADIATTPSGKEMQKQFSINDEMSPSVTTTTEENTTWPEYDLSSELRSDFEKTSPFLQKLIYNKYPYGEND